MTVKRENSFFVETFFDIFDKEREIVFVPMEKNCDRKKNLSLTLLKRENFAVVSYKIRV